MASNVSNKRLIEFEAGPTTRKRLALVGNAVPRPPASATDEESDDGSVFEILGDQGRGADSRICAHCQYICDNWSKGLNDRNFVFPHCGDILQLEVSAAAGCTTCAQFLQNQSSDDVRRAKDEMKQHWSPSFDAGF
jgi:hypothetical protein